MRGFQNSICQIVTKLTKAVLVDYLTLHFSFYKQKEMSEKMITNTQGKKKTAKKLQELTSFWTNIKVFTKTMKQ